jgi:hypothetical protein
MMESNFEQQEAIIEEELSEPHFDEEATLLSARPVVPLAEVRAEARRGRLFFAFAIIAALIMGAVGGAFLYKGQGQDQHDQLAETEMPFSGTPIQSGAAGMAIESNETVSRAENDETAPRDPGNVASSVEHEAPSVSREVFKTQEKPVVDRSDELTPEERRAERKEARRLRRQTEREARQNARGDRVQSGDDLLRIREIFEGLPRP